MRNNSCESCLEDVSCLWCNSPKKCVDYPASQVLPSASICALSAARWGVCWCKYSIAVFCLAN